IIGKNYCKFYEANELLKLKGLVSVSSSEQFSRELNKIIVNKKLRISMGEANKKFIKSNTGSTKTIIQKIS
ncbi:MAG: 3-deoxy-D-manno-octulosonic acid transferase, partial [Bacteroidota bacterium]|nr:3-deoxy-D-manno-octulosonic acid transferase [Bacteroidota bacterium]